MIILDKLNAVRRFLMQSLTKNIGVNSRNRKIDLSHKIEIKKILICRPNHKLGNLILVTPLLQEVIATFPNCKIDLFIKGNLGPILFENYENVDKIINLPRKHFSHIIQYFKAWTSLKSKYYDLAINIDKNSSSGKLSVLFCNSKYKFFGDGDEVLNSKHSDYFHIAKFPIYNLRRYLTELGFEKRELPIASLNLKLSLSEIEEGKKIVNNLVDKNDKTICLYTYATGHKCYSESWWSDFYKALKAQYHDYNIIEVLPIENVSQIGFKEPTFYSKNIREIGAVIANTDIFIGADSGIMHLASSVKVTTVGLFSVSNIEKYQPYNNKSVAINTNDYDFNESIEILNEILIKKGVYA